MKYCSRCGKELLDDAIFCTNCGCAVDPSIRFVRNEEDKVSVWFCVLAFLIPIFGLIYWAIKREETPKKANAVGITALISWVASIIMSVITSFFVASLFSTILTSFTF